MNRPANAGRQIDRAEKLSVKTEGSHMLQIRFERKTRIETGDAAELPQRCGCCTAKRWQLKGNGHALTHRHELALRKARQPGTSAQLEQ